VPLLSAPEPGPGDADLSFPPCFVPDAGEPPASSRVMVPERPPRPRLPPERGPPRLVVEEEPLAVVVIAGRSRGLGVKLSSLAVLGLGVSAESSGRSSGAFG
jgi:hypothetical protein